jgi:hypothetical protein
MGVCLITEGIVLMRWCEKNGYGPFVMTGLSMGGYVRAGILIYLPALTQEIYLKNVTKKFKKRWLV